MKKINKFIISFIFVLILIIIGYYFYNLLNNTSTQKNNKIITEEIDKIRNKENLLNENEILENNNNSITQIEIQKDDKIEILRKRFTLRGIITKGDNFIESNQYILALNEYLKAIKQNPNDTQILKKIALVYFELKKFDNTIKTFEEILTQDILNQEENEKYILSLMYNIDFKSKESISQTAQKIKDLNLDTQEKFYYINSINCVINFHECKKMYQNYIDKKEILSSKMLSIKNALINFKNFGVDQLYYKDAILIGEFFKNKNYNISNKLGIDLLKEKPDYKPILLIVGKGFYEIGNMGESKKYLEMYYNLEPKDVNITYLLGNISFKMQDYINSNLYYNSALKNGFKDSLELKRKLVYNYYLLGDKRSMLNIFGFLIEEDNATIDDFSLAIYYAILEKRFLNAIKWSELGIKKFKNLSGYEIFYGYLGWIYREENQIEKAGDYISKGLKINSKNPLITLNAGYIEELKENYNIALIYFKRTININGDGEFGELAKNEIEQIEKLNKILK